MFSWLKNAWLLGEIPLTTTNVIKKKTFGKHQHHFLFLSFDSHVFFLISPFLQYKPRTHKHFCIASQTIRNMYSNYFAQARKSSTELSDNISRKIDKMVNTVKVISIMLQNNAGQQEFDLNWKKAVVGTVDANQKFEDLVYKCR